MEGIIDELYKVIVGRKEAPAEGSYTNYLLSKGSEKICKKVGEEAVEVILAATSGKKEQTVEELADLVYHVLVLMVQEGITPAEVEAALRERR